MTAGRRAGCACSSSPAPGRPAGCATPQGRPALPDLEPVAVVALADELRPEVAATIARFRENGVALKVLSGDDPRTVAALATRAGLDPGEPVPGAALDGLDDAAVDRLVARTTVFGRVAPEHKERLVAALRRQGHYVAMIGDGVNDARALKRAQVGVAMRSGSARHPRRRRHRARRRLLRRPAARPARGPQDHQRHRDVDVRVPGPGREPGPGDRRGDHARAGLPLLPHPGRADPAHRRRPDAVPHLLGPPDAHRPAPARQPRPLRPARRTRHRGLRHRRLRVPLRVRHQVPQLRPHPRPGRSATSRATPA